jgi:endonuclease/exonuclease/phosphatase family metal-dependent hydrolase
MSSFQHLDVIGRAAPQSQMSPLVRTGQLAVVLAAVVALSCAAASSSSQPPRAGFLHRPSPDVLRVMAWNIGADSVVPPEGTVADLAGAGRPSQFARVVRAVAPDVLCLQEIRADAAWLARMIGAALPLESGGTWHAYQGGVDNAIVSRYELAARNTTVAPGGIRPRGHVTALIRLPPGRGAADLYMACAHFQSSNGPEHVAARQHHADAIVGEIRDAKAGRGPVPLAARTPFLILGDLNAVPGQTAFLDHLLAGRLTQETGPPAAGLDWDGSAVTDAHPSHNGSGRDTHTWRNDRDKFAPSALDRLLYSDSVLRVRNAFVLDTTTMTAGDLDRSGMRAVDVMRDPAAGIHDHLPIVVDFDTVPGAR